MYTYRMEPKEFSPEWFDASSAAWRANKRRKGESYKYICQHQHKNGKLCKRDSFMHAFDNTDLLCKYHWAELSNKRYKEKASKFTVVECPDSL
jgi:hypothetical protein